MKHLRDHAKSAMASKLARHGGSTDIERVKTGMPMRDGAKGYATGGAVIEDIVEGAPAKPRLDRAARKKGGKDKEKVNVNVIVMPKEGKDAPPPAPALASGAPVLPPAPMPPMPPASAGPGAPPVPMRKHGGAVKGLDAGAGGAKGRLEKIKRYGK